LLASLAAAGAIAASLLAGCGDDEPSYCNKVDDFELAVQDLKEVNIPSGGVNAVTSAVDKVQSTGQAAAQAAKADFAPQTTAVTTALGALQATLKQLSDPQTRTAALTQLPVQIRAVGTATDNLVSATKDSCG
jgi:hypothetical protein